MERLNRKLSNNYGKDSRLVELLLGDLTKTIVAGQGKLDKDKMNRLSEYKSRVIEKKKIIEKLENLQGVHIQNARNVTIGFANNYKDLLRKVDNEVDKFIDIVIKI